MLRNEALARDFVVSEVQLSADSCPLFDLLQVYRKVVEGLRTAQSATAPALESVLGRWLRQLKTAQEDVRRRSLERLPLDMQAALLAYLQANNFLRPSPHAIDTVLRWLL